MNVSKGERGWASDHQRRFSQQQPEKVQPAAARDSVSFYVFVPVHGCVIMTFGPKNIKHMAAVAAAVAAA